MPSNILLPRMNAVLAAMALSMAFGLGVTTAPPAVAGEYVDSHSVVRGGRLYDNWYKEARKEPPVKAHSAYPATGSYADDAAMTWRCKECHGWDYKGKDGAYGKGSHYTGIVGIRAMAGAEPDMIIAVLKDKTHGYDKMGLMLERDFRDLATFVSQGQVDMDAFIDPATGEVKGDKLKRQDHFQSICATCHGVNGQEIGSVPPLGKTAKENPWEFLHNLINGHPNEAMPALRSLDTQLLADVIAYSQTLPDTPTLASISRGGRLYDNWYKETGFSMPSKPHPAYPRDKAFANQPLANWRCVECHGWDYKGKDGAYGSGRHATGIPGIRSWAGVDPAKIIAILRDETHGYRLSDKDARDIANFVSMGQLDMDTFINRKSGALKADLYRHKDFYLTVCSNCHGLEGTDILGLPPIGVTARENPQKVLHNLFNGHPGEGMPPLRALGTQYLADVLAYTQILTVR